MVAPLQEQTVAVEGMNERERLQEEKDAASLAADHGHASMDGMCE